MLLTRVIAVVMSATVTVCLLFALTGAGERVPPVGNLLDPHSGLYMTARRSMPSATETINISSLAEPVSVIRDERGVPHIFAASDRDALIALGVVVAQDRLFQLDFIPRAASGRLSEVLGPGALQTDRFLRSIGMELGAHINADRLTSSHSDEADLVEWFCAGVNSVIDAARPRDLPFEMRLLGYEPDRCSALQVARVLQFMSYDLTYKSDEALYGLLREGFSTADYEQLYPTHAAINDPIIPAPAVEPEDLSASHRRTAAAPSAVVSELHDRFAETKAFLGFGFEDGKGSNNWAVSGRRSATGSPILAGDMHLRVSLPAIWYEAHIATPTMNLYGVTIPGAPGLVEAFNSRVAWAFTNTGSDQIDHVLLQLNAAGTAYRTDQGWNPLKLVADTIHVRGADPVVDTLRFSPWGPVIRSTNDAIAIRWVAHDSSRTLGAAWRMSHAKSLDEFEEAIRSWDSPMQNILYADVDGNIAIRSTGTLPIRTKIGTGAGVVEGSGDRPLWSGRVPFDELPHSVNPSQGYLASANQEPAGSWYQHYLGHDWRSIYRALRINELLQESETHSVGDFQRYQSDVVAVHGRHFVGRLDSLSCRNPAAEEYRIRLVDWDGDMRADEPTPLRYDEWIDVLADLAWDEPVFALKQPHAAQLYRLLEGDVDAKWADVVSTPAVEGVADLLCRSLQLASDQLEMTSQQTWGDAHKIVFRHLISSDQFATLSRGPYAYPGTWETLSPGRGRSTTHSASWRVIVDLSKSPPEGFGVYPGGVSGNPFSPLYDLHIPTYLDFELFRLHNPASADYFDDREVVARHQLLPR